MKTTPNKNSDPTKENEVKNSVNQILFDEMGLEIGPRYRVFDQDTGQQLKFIGMDIVAPRCLGGKTSVAFDPYGNRKLMTQLFGYFLNKYESEEDVDVLSYYTVDGTTPDKSCIACKMSDNTVVKSGEYRREVVRITDLIMRLNGATDVDLSQYDLPIERSEQPTYQPPKKINRVPDRKRRDNK